MRRAVKLLAMGAAILFAAQAFCAADERPNILLILADDLGYNDVGFTGTTEIFTPQLDRLAEGGVIFENGYVTHPYCGPSRAGLLTGRHQARFGMENNATYSPFDPHMGLRVGEKTFAKRLQEAGYRTGIIGKWHLGAAPPFHPNNRGFEYFYGFLSGGHNYFPEGVSNRRPLTLENGKPNYGANEGMNLPLVRNEGYGEFNEYLTTALSRDAAKFVAESEQPFFLYLAYNAPHTPLEAPQEFIEKYGHIEDPDRRVYAAMIDAMDAGIGMVVDALKSSGKYENTLIFFLSDNGGVYPEFWVPHEDWADNSPFRRGKVALLEGGIHVPFIAHWPTKIPAGATFDGLVSALDIAATSVAVGEADATDGRLEGVDLVPYVTGEKSGSPHEALFWHLEEDDSWAVRTPADKFMRQGLAGLGRAYFDMVADRAEGENRIGRNPRREAELAALWNAWNESNIPNVLLQAFPYQERRAEFYEQLYRERLEQSANRERAVAE